MGRSILGNGTVLGVFMTRHVDDDGDYIFDIPTNTVRTVIFYRNSQGEVVEEIRFAAPVPVFGAWKRKADRVWAEILAHQARENIASLPKGRLRKRVG